MEQPVAGETPSEVWGITRTDPDRPITHAWDMAQPTPPLDPRLLNARAGERTTAVATAAVGAALLVAAAGTFIAITWETMGLVGKAGVIGFVALAALAAGHALRNAVPGVAAVLVHLGGYLIPIDVGGVATAVGLDRPRVGVLAGLVGAAVLFGLDRRNSPFMAIGRVLSLGAAGLGLAAIVGGPPAIPLLLMGAVAVGLSFRSDRFAVDALGLALLSAVGPLLTYGSTFTSSGSFIDWLADLATTSPLATTIIAAAAITLSLLTSRRTSRRWPGLVVAGAIGAIALPDVVSLIGSYNNEALVFLAATTLLARLVVHQSRAHGWQWLVDQYTGLVTVMAGLFALEQLGNGQQLALLATAVLLISSWLVADLASGLRLDPSRHVHLWLWHGSSGPISTLGLATASLLLAAGTADFLQAAAVIVTATTALGLSERKHATLVARSGFALGLLLALGTATAVMVIGVAAASLLMARALLDFHAGAAPWAVRLTQLIGLGLLTFASVRFPIENQVDVVGAIVAAAAATLTVIIVALAADQLPIPDLRLPPRAALALCFAPLLAVDVTTAGIWAIGLAVLLLVDHLSTRLAGSDVVAAPLVLAGTWLIGLGESINAIEMYTIGPALVMLWFGSKAMRSGDSSWIGLTPGVVLFGGSALVERVAEGPGWHGAMAGAVGLAALGLGVERKWSGPTITGGLLLGTVVLIEASAVVPRIPVWMLLAIGGSALLVLGLGLERRAGVGQTAGFRATWAQFT